MQVIGERDYDMPKLPVSIFHLEKLKKKEDLIKLIKENRSQNQRIQKRVAV